MDIDQDLKGAENEQDEINERKTEATMDDLEEELLIVCEEAGDVPSSKEILKERKGILISMTSLKPAVYPHIDKTVLTALETLSECWSDPIIYSKSRDTQKTFDTMPAIKTWFGLNDPTL